MRLLDVKEQRARHRIIAGRDRVDRGHHPIHRRDLQLVGVVLIKRQAEHADRGLVGGDARQGLGVIAVDVHRNAIGAQGKAPRQRVLLLGILIGTGRGRQEQVIAAHGLAARFQHLDVEHFARAVLGAGNEGHDVLRGQARVHVGPGSGAVCDQSAILDGLRGQGTPDIRRGQREIGARDVAGKDDAVIAKAHFHDLGHAIGIAQIDVRLLDAAGGIGDIDGRFAQAFTQLLAPGTRPAALDDRRVERALLAKGFGHDGGIGQNGRRTGNLQLVAGLSPKRRGRQYGQRRGGKSGEGHLVLLSGHRVEGRSG